MMSRNAASHHLTES